MLSASPYRHLWPPMMPLTHGQRQPPCARHCKTQPSQAASTCSTSTLTRTSAGILLALLAVPGLGLSPAIISCPGKSSSVFSCQCSEGALNPLFSFPLREDQHQLLQVLPGLQGKENNKNPLLKVTSHKVPQERAGRAHQRLMALQGLELSVLGGSVEAANKG